ncbi:MAG: hypothetical protein KDD89_06730, partial [Anaerolineales bacterium]|nr:hypothetical protein [Anaerolineales bacterium]
MLNQNNKTLVEFVSFITPDGVEYPIFGGRRSLLSWEGMGMPPVRYLEERGTFQNGVTVRDYRVDQRTITVQQFERGLCREDFYCSVGNLIEAIRPNRDSNKGAGQLLVVLKNGAQRTIKARYYDGVRADWGNEPILDSDMLESITFYCEEPFWDDVEREIVGAGVIDVGSCLPICLPACFGSDIINAEVELVYTGTWDGDRLTIYINGPALAPTVANLTTGQQIKLNYNVASGETILIEIDPQSQRIVSSTAGVLPPGIIDNVSDLVTFYLATRGNLTADGTNIMQITASGGVAGQTSVQVEYTIRHWSLFAPCFVPKFPQPIFYAPYLTDTDSDILPLSPITDTGALLTNNDQTGRTALYADAALTNAIKNPSFEVNTTGWTTIATAAISRELGNAYSGQYSLKVVANAANDGVRSNPLTSVVVSASTTYTLQCNLISASSSWRLRVLYYTAASGFISTTNYAITAGYNSQQILTPATAAYMYIDFYNTAGGGAIGYFDGIALFETDYSPPYFDGSFPGATWSGTADDSTSTKAAINLLYQLPQTLSNQWTISGWIQPSAFTGLAPIPQYALKSDGGA